MSLPSRERGLKSRVIVAIHRPGAVAPFAGAWIEINIFTQKAVPLLVAPFAGAWIEM